ncbi:MAG: leucine-rich repeat protein [Eubacterium sp.]|nr:leucine-rich repeat protein [Eubacterium sp.]
MKKTLSLSLSLIIFILAILSSATVFADDIPPDDVKIQLGSTDTYYSYNSASKTLTISGTGATPNLKRDSNSHPWNSWDSLIEYVVVEEGITAIGDYFFYNMPASDFLFPSTLVSLGKESMSSVNSLKSIVLPEGLEEIGESAFYYSVMLESINIPSTVKSIGKSAFENCYALNSLTFDDMYMNVAIGNRAFFSCRNLMNVTLPKRAAMSSNNSYAFGFYYSKKAYFVYDDFMLNVYRDSPSYEYAVNSIVNTDNYSIINEFVIREGQSVERTFYSDYYSDEMIFIFTPSVSDNYKFFSSSDIKTVDVDCSFNGKTYTDNSLDDLNFTVSAYLEKGRTYYFTVKCVSEISAGDFTVSLINTHNYQTVVIPPTLTDDGYTAYTCTNCGDCFNAEYIKRLGVKVTGKVVLMEEPDGSHSHNYPVENAVISVDDENIMLTENDGSFEFYILPDAEYLTVSTQFGIDRVFDFVCDDNMEMSLGDISFFNFDYVKDCYINAKDFAFMRKLYGRYSKDDTLIFAQLDYNKDGKIDDADYVLAQSFLTYGKITESIYY